MADGAAVGDAWRMARIFITGSTDGLGLAAGRALLRDGHQVVLHARSAERARAIDDVAGASVVVGDLSSAAETHALADRVNALGRMDTVIHNAGVYLEQTRGTTPEGHARTLAVNVLAPYLLTALVERPARLVYLSSGMHRGGTASLADIDWKQRRWSASAAYSDSKLLLVALNLAVARRWPEVLANAVDPGWVPTKMGGAGAPDDLQKGHETQAWLAVSDDAAARTSGGYWYHRERQRPAEETLVARYQDEVVERLAELTGVELPR